MSATNWAICPRCLKQLQANKKLALHNVKTAYGVIPVEEWMSLSDQAQAMPATLDQSTLREDYNNFGVDEDGVFYCHYRAECSVCPFSFTYDIEINALEKVK